MKRVVAFVLAAGTVRRALLDGLAVAEACTGQCAWPHASGAVDHGIAAYAELDAVVGSATGGACGCTGGAVELTMHKSQQGDRP